MEIYTEKIAAAQDFETLCNIIEEAADDERITNETYCDVYALCVNAARSMGAGILRAEHMMDTAVANANAPALGI